MNIRSHLLALAFAGCATLLSSAARAEVVSEGKGIYTVSGTWTFWAEKSLLAPGGKENHFGEFQTVLFKPECNEAEEVTKFKKTFATLKVLGRESVNKGGDKVLVAEKILEVNGSPADESKAKADK